MNNLLKSLGTVGLCVIASAGCKSQLLRSRAETMQRPAADVAELETEPSEDMSLGQASYEQFAANPNASPWGRSPYHFGGAGSTSTSNSFGSSASSAGAKRC
jgi:hypothetical protein